MKFRKMIKILHTQKKCRNCFVQFAFNPYIYSSNILLPENKISDPFPPIYEMGFASTHLKATHNDASYASSICSSSPPLFPPFHIILALNTRWGYIIATQMLRYIMAANIYDMAWPSFDPSLFQVWGGHCLDIRIVPSA